MRAGPTPCRKVRYGVGSAVGPAVGSVVGSGGVTAPAAASAR